MVDRTSSSVAAHQSVGTKHTALLPFHSESIRIVTASADALFSHLDDHNRLAGHMSQSSWLMAGSRMAIQLDAAEGRANGSHIHLHGRVLSIPIHVEEVVTEHELQL